MPNTTIPDWKKAAIVALSPKYGYRALATRLDISIGTVKKYQRKAQQEGAINMEGVNLKVAEC